MLNRTLPRVLWLVTLSFSLLSQILFATRKSHTVLAQEAATPNVNPEVSRPAAPLAVQYLFPEQISVIAGKQTTTDLHFRVANGLHINSHKPFDKNLIPTNLVVIEQPGLKVAAVDFPAGKDFAFSFAPTEKISVYSDEFILHAHITAERGDHLLQGALRYQACDASTCFPPKTIPVAIDIIAK